MRNKELDAMDKRRSAARLKIEKQRRNLAAVKLDMPLPKYQDLVPTRQELRDILRRGMLVPSGTKFTGEGHSISHFFSVYESERTVERNSPRVVHLIVEEVERDSATKKEERFELFQIFTGRTAMRAIRAGETMRADDLAEPQEIISAARQLYPE